MRYSPVKSVFREISFGGAGVNIVRRTEFSGKQLSFITFRRGLQTIYLFHNGGTGVKYQSHGSYSTMAKHGLVDHRTNIYALGATLYEQLTLQPAVGGNDREEIFRNLTGEEPQNPRAFNSSIPTDLEFN